MSSVCGPDKTFPTGAALSRMVEPCMEAAGIEPAQAFPPNPAICEKLVHRVAENVDEELGFRLASLADGEGCFVIGKTRNRHSKTGYNCSFVVKMRADDWRFLLRFADWTDLGKLYGHDAVKSDGHDRKPQISWKVHTKEDCLALVLIFDAFPLWSKKKNDYAIWRQAVIVWNSHIPGGGWHEMELLHGDLIDCRQYRPAEHAA